MLTHETCERVRYAHTDKMGYLYYGNYAAFYEIGRVEALRSIGISYKEMEDKGCLLVVTNLECKYLLPAFYDEQIKIVTEIVAMPKMGLIVFNHSLYNEQQVLINKGVVRVLCVDINSRKKMSTPATLINALKPYFDR